MSDQELSDYYRSEIEAAWGVIANVSGGDWSKQSVEWQAAAHVWGAENGFRLKISADKQWKCVVCDYGVRTSKEMLEHEHEEPLMIIGQTKGDE